MGPCFTKDNAVPKNPVVYDIMSLWLSRTRVKIQFINADRFSLQSVTVGLTQSAQLICGRSVCIEAVNRLYPGYMST